MRKRTRRASSPPKASSRERFPFDRGRHPNALALVGYVRRSGKSEPLRLYVSPNREDYLEIRRSDVLGQRRAYGGRGQKLLWLKRSASIREVHLSMLEAMASYLSGRMTDRHLREAATRSMPIFFEAARPPIGPTTAASVCFACRLVEVSADR